jgi:hypothetical protein
LTKVETFTLVAALAGALAGAGSLHAQTGWALWQRPVDTSTGQPRDAWKRLEVFEAERWCKGAMTRAINQTLAAGEKGGRRDPKVPLSEFQCLPAGQDPRTR